MKIKTGIGIDVHQLEPGRELWLGGIKIEHEKGCVAHSDGDVLLHAICDALFGAAGMGDIGQHFPDTYPAYKGIDSKILLAKTKELVERQGYAISNIDSVVCLQRPKIRPFIDDMRACIAEILEMDNGIACESVDPVTGTCTTGAAFATCAGFLCHSIKTVDKEGFYAE